MTDKLTKAQAKKLTFTDLKRVATPLGIKDNSKKGLLREMEAAGHFADEPVEAAGEASETVADGADNKLLAPTTFWEIVFSRSVVLASGESLEAGVEIKTEDAEVAFNALRSGKIASFKKFTKEEGNAAILISEYNGRN